MRLEAESILRGTMAALARLVSGPKGKAMGQGGLALLGALAAAALVAACGPSIKAVPLEPEKLQAEDGKWLERRSDHYGNGRIAEVWYVYRDSSGNFIRHGADRHYYRNGQLKFIEHYRDGRLEGSTEFWYQNGAKQGELPFQNGKPHGKALTWFPNGRKKSEKNWVDGQLHGLSIEWDKKGRKVEEVMWIRNRREKAGAGPVPSKPESEGWKSHPD